MTDLLDGPTATMSEGRVAALQDVIIRSVTQSSLWLTSPRSSSASWLPRIDARLAALCELGPGWDDGEALPVDRDLALRVRSFLAGVAATEIIEPDVVPTQDGGLQIEWHTKDLDIVLAVEPHEEPGAYVHDHLTDEDWEGALSGFGARLAAVWSRLAA